MNVHIASSICLTCFLVFGVPAAVAADFDPPVPQERTPDSGWTFQVTPYVWAAGTKGDVSPFRRLPTVSIEKSFSDVLEDLNVAGFINLWARNDRFVISGDLMYVNLTESRAIGQLPIIGGIPPVGASVDTSQFAASLQAGYRFYDAPEFTFDVLAGARYWRIETDAQVSFLGSSQSFQSDFGWLDPTVGARAHYRINDKLSILAQGDVGGFGAGSDLTWQALATVNYSFNDKITVSAGYKALSVDYDKDGHVFDTTLKGPVLGLTVRF